MACSPWVAGSVPVTRLALCAATRQASVRLERRMAQHGLPLLSQEAYYNYGEKREEKAGGQPVDPLLGGCYHPP